MSRSSYRILADEKVERQAARNLQKRGHDVERVVNVLGDGPVRASCDNSIQHRIHIPDF